MHSQELLKRLESSDKQRIKSMLIELVAKTQYLTKKDINTWRQAWQMAINIENPQRSNLYDVYTDVDIDLHLSGCVGQRRDFVLKKSFKLVDFNTQKEDKNITELFEEEWFKNFCEEILNSRYWGHSLVQLGDIVSVIGKKKFADITLVPRKHVIPEYGVIVKEVGDEPKKGIDYRTGSIADWVIEAGGKKDLGLFLKCAPQTLSKKNMLGFWDAFGEMFGMPIRIGKTTSRDSKEITKVERMLSDMGAAAWGLFPEGTEIEIKETQRGDAFEVYDKRVERANSEISKGILNQTMTIDNGSSKSQGEVHLEIFQNVVERDADFVKDIVNNKLIPIMSKHGFGVEKYKFQWDEAIDYTPEQQIQIDTLMVQNFDIDPKYFAEKYNIPIIGKKQAPDTNFFE
jgi:hypothetical protein